jgi:hypothetical protein
MFKRIRQYKLLLFELCETLGTICILLSGTCGSVARGSAKTSMREILMMHCARLREYSEFLREDNNG